MKLKIISIFVAYFFSLSAHAYQAAVVSAHPLASRAGMEVLKEGGSAADAAIAAAFALSVVEPYYSGLGGGGFLLYYEAKSKKVSFVDYRETAPAMAKPTFYRNHPDRLNEGIHSVAVPGFVAGMEAIFRQWGKLSWARAIEPAIILAKAGIPLDVVMKKKIEQARERLQQDAGMTSVFLKPYGEGKPITQPELARTLEEIEKKGAKAFYRGKTGRLITVFMKRHRGFIRETDLQNYQVKWRLPFKFVKAPYEIVSSPLPSSGGMALDLLFKKVIIYGVARHFPYTWEAYDGILHGLKDYFDFRAIAWGDTRSNLTSAHTTHLCVIDAKGNIASMTNTINAPFGSGLMAAGTGTILNNEMGDFSLDRSTPNRIAASRRPLSSMAPTIIFKNKEPHMVIGTPGGMTIPQNLFQVLYALWDWRVPLPAAINQSKFYYSPSDKGIIVEKHFPKRVWKKWEESHPIIVKDAVGNVQALKIIDKAHTATFSDPRGIGRGYTQ